MSTTSGEYEVPPPWWDRFEVDEDHAVHFRIGPLSLWVQRLPGEWRVVHWSEPDPMADHAESVRVDEIAEPPTHGRVVRFATERPDRTLVIQPMLADRPLVTRPETPVHVVAGDAVSFFVGSPLWVQLGIGDPVRVLTELPTLRPSDTWFGPSTLVGDLAYAARTHARRTMETVRPKPSRAITHVVIRNEGTDNFQIERINLPIPRLSLYRNDAGFLWTSSVTLERTADSTLAKLDTSGPPPAVAGKVTRIAGPRLPDERNVLVRTISALLG